VARGNFVVDADWSDGLVDRMTITSRAGGVCRIAVPDAAGMHLRDASGAVVDTTRDARGNLAFSTVPGGVYRLSRAEP
jgi:hypothetical protein